MHRWTLLLAILLLIPACRRNSSESDALGGNEGSAEFETHESPLVAEAASEGSEVATEDPHADDDAWSYDSERLGTFYVGMLRSALREELLDPPERSERTQEAGSGFFVETWSYPRRGLTFVFESPNEAGDMLLRSIELTGQGPLRTSRQVGIAATRERVLEAYVDAPILLRDDAVIVGTEQRGIRFNFSQTRVATIYIGPNP